MSVDWTKLSPDLWRLILRFVELHDLPNVFCVKFLKDITDHQNFWLHRYLCDFSTLSSRIRTADDKFVDWKKIRKVYKQLLLLDRLDFRKVDLNDIKLSDWTTAQRLSLKMRHISYKNSKFLIQTPVVRFPFGVRHHEHNNNLLTAVVDSQGLGKEFLDFIMSLDSRIIEKTAQKEPYHSVVKLKENYPPSLSLKVDEKWTTCQGVDGNVMRLDDIKRGAKGMMMLRLQYYYVMEGRGSGLKWGVDAIKLISNGEPALQYDFIF